MLDTSALQPGKSATLAVMLDVAPKLHAQSHKPLSGDYIPTAVEMQPTPGLTFGSASYPPGQMETYPNVGTLSVYSGRAVILVPVEVGQDVQTGTELAIAGGVLVQICDDTGTCFLPQTLPFEIKAKVVGADQAVTANEPELFKNAAATIAAPPPAAGPVTPAAPSEENVLAGYSLPAVFGIAFLVGIIFNIVPCVLPVLPLKAIGFYETAQHNRAKSVTFGLAFSLGVVASFAVLGLLVVVLRAFTWGEIFSNPWFSLVLVVILVAMALNMFGVFTVNLPAGAYAFTPRHDTYIGNFLFGILTAALSTPCTFGLFVSVLAVALTQPPVVGLILVSTVGAGMASPYLALSALPEVARKFPRTGPWAELVKQSMGFLLLAVAVFFAQGWLSRVIDQHNVWWLIFAIVAAGGVFLVAKSVKYGKTAVAPTVAVVLALLIVAPAFYAARLLAVKPYEWQPYTSELLANKQAGNKVVLVEFTASWCSNCHALEALVLNSKDVQRAVQQHEVEMIKADLTNTEAPGWDLLKNKLQAEGVPLTVIYSPNLRQPIQLTGFYTRGDLTAALAKAASPQTAMR